MEVDNVATPVVDGPAPVTPPAAAAGSTRQMLLSLMAGQNSLRREMNEVKAGQAEFRLEMGSVCCVLNWAIR